MPKGPKIKTDAAIKEVAQHWKFTESNVRKIAYKNKKFIIAVLKQRPYEQGRSRLGLEAQKAAVHDYLAAIHRGLELANYTEVESGKVNARSKLDAALLLCRQTRATLLVAKLDRLSRNAALLNLKDAGVKFQALDLPEVNSLTLGVLAAIAQHEQETISARTKAALAARKARGLPLGTPRDLSAYAAKASIQAICEPHQCNQEGGGSRARYRGRPQSWEHIASSNRSVPEHGRSADPARQAVDGHRVKNARSHILGADD